MDKHRKAVLSFPFQIDPWTHHAALCDEAQRIRTSVFLILSTHVKERWMLSSFGSRLKDYVFENQGVETEDMIQREIIASSRCRERSSCTRRGPRECRMPW